MDNFTFSLKNILEGEGIGISITGMLIVFCALSLIALFISVIPWVLRKLGPILPKGMELLEQGPPVSQKTVPAQVDESIVAAIGYALYQKHISGK